jgi:shikimate dehydrogenase
VPQGEVAAALARLIDEGFAGCNVTVPHKEAALAAADEASEIATTIGAANTLVFRQGRIRADNSDAFGFLQNLAEGAPGWSAREGPAVVLGAGGAARAVLVALAEAGAPEIRLLNRTLSRAETLAGELPGNISVRPLEDATAFKDANLLVNTTALGMTGQPALDLDLAALPRDALVNDIVYTPLETPLLAAAKARGNPTVDGLGMLLHQARPGFEAWFGRAPEVTPELRAHVLAGLAGLA